MQLGEKMQKTFRTLDLAIHFYEMTQKLKLTGNLKDRPGIES